MINKISQPKRTNNNIPKQSWENLVKDLPDEEKKLYLKMYTNSFSEVPVSQPKFEKFKRVIYRQEKKQLQDTLRNAEEIIQKPKPITDYTKKDIPALLDAILTKKI